MSAGDFAIEGVLVSSGLLRPSLKETRSVTINDATKFTMGSDVRCSDGECGKLRRVVIDPVGRTLTHLVVEPAHRESAGRLVPIDLVSSTSSEIELTCSLADFDQLEHAQELRFLPGAQGEWGYEQQDMLSWPYYGLGPVGPAGPVGPGVGVGGGVAPDRSVNSDAQVTAYEHIPAGEVQVRRGEHVHATDGLIGRVQGLVVDPGDHHVTHVLLDEGHLWGLKQVAIPIGSVTGVEDGVHLDLTKDQVRDLPPVELDEQK
jgi:sporulation protein YlmC with PRC-barrel domain